MNNDSMSANSTEVDYGEHSVGTIISLSIAYGLLSLTAFVGNFIVIWIIYCGRRMHTVMNIYIGNLAMADVIIAVFCIPFQFQAALLNRWDLPAFMCKLCPFLQSLSITVSIFTLVVIALDRYRGIIWPLKASSSKFRAKMMMVMVWLFGTLVALPNLISFHVTDHPEQDGIKGCTIDLKTIGGESTWRLYLMSGVLIQYCIPLLIITFCHCHMAQVLWGTKTPGQAYDQRDEVILANKRKVTKMLSIVVVLFGICWLPFQTFNFLSAVQVPLSFSGVNYVWMACHILAMSNSCCNPLIYGIYNTKFRREFDRKYGILWGRGEDTEARNGFELQEIPKNITESHHNNLSVRNRDHTGSLSTKSNLVTTNGNGTTKTTAVVVTVVNP